MFMKSTGIALIALITLISGLAYPPGRPSLTGVPVDVSALRISVTLASGLRCFITAHAPATCGVAMEVPALVPKRPPGTEELIKYPGARRSTMPVLLLND